LQTTIAKFTILGVETPAWQTTQAQAYPVIPSFRSAARREATANEWCSYFCVSPWWIEIFWGYFGNLEFEAATQLNLSPQSGL